jgi:hypothetical protein
MSIEDARAAKNMFCTIMSDAVRQQNDLKACQTDAYKQQEFQRRTKRSARYYAADRCRDQEWEAKKMSMNVRYAETRADKADAHSFRAEMKRIRTQRNEQICSALERNRAARAQFEADTQRSELLKARCLHLREGNLKREDQIDAFRDVQQQCLEMQRIADLSKEMQKKQARILHLRREQCLWQLAASGETTSHELALEEKIRQEQEALAAFGVATSTPQVEPVVKRRPRSANATCGRRPTPSTSGISEFSVGTRIDAIQSANKEALQREAAKCGPRVSVIDPRVGVGTCTG